MENLKKEYAKLTVVKGVNVQKDQDVIITASVEDKDFVKYVIEECYLAGARSVSVDWSFAPLSVLSYKYETVETLSEVPEWKKARMEYRVKTLPAQIHIISSDPDSMKEIDQNKMMQVNRVVRPIMKKYRDEMDNKFQWTIVGIPSNGWAKKVFPELNEEAAVLKLWENILKVSRVDGNAIENWNAHNKFMHDKCEKLNELDLLSLHYTNSLGTDFTVELIKDVIFCGGSGQTVSGVVYNPNIPTEECFTTPNKNSANGVVMSSKPLSVMGKLVDNFGFRFENGKIVEVLGNEEDKALLEQLISLDEGARMLGEVALVPYSSPVCQSNVLFFNTLYDENAACHLAIGAGFPDCIKGFEKLSEEEIKAFNLNESMIHVDFMIGTKDLNIVGTTRDGKTVQIFKDGEFAI